MYSKIKTFRTTEQQYETLLKMKSYNIDVSRFIRDAIKQKLKRESFIKNKLPLSEVDSMIKKLETILK